MPTDTLLHALTALHHTLATKWLLREFRTRGAPPTAAVRSPPTSRLLPLIQTMCTGHGPRNQLRTRARDAPLARLRRHERTLPPPHNHNPLTKKQAITTLLESLTAHKATSRALRRAAEECLAGLRAEEWVSVDRDEEELVSGEWVGVARGDDEVHV